MDFNWHLVSEELPECYPKELKGNDEDFFRECLVVDEDGDYGVGFYREDAKAWDSCNFGWLETKHLVDNKEAFSEPCRLGKIVAWTYFEEFNIKEFKKSV